jgi:hypothetical protein
VTLHVPFSAVQQAEGQLVTLHVPFSAVQQAEGQLAAAKPGHSTSHFRQILCVEQNGRVHLGCFLEYGH